ncbi:MAG TPA: OsmC family protein [Vicinamibacterales bacterium]|nr:OsmC family protein [Vicinamibacterales bacterium]
MKPLPHRYDVQLKGGPTGYAHLSSVGRRTFATAPPREFGGPGDAWSPEHLLLASVEACFLFTFRAVARASKLDFADVNIHAEGTVDHLAGVTKFTEIVIRPRLTFAPHVDRAKVAAVVAKTEKACLVSATLATPVRVETEIVETEAAA